MMLTEFSRSEAPMTATGFRFEQAGRDSAVRDFVAPLWALFLRFACSLWHCSNSAQNVNKSLAFPLWETMRSTKRFLDDAATADGAVDWTAIGDFQHPGALFGVSGAVDAMSRVMRSIFWPRRFRSFFMGQGDADMPERQCFHFGMRSVIAVQGRAH